MKELLEKYSGLTSLTQFDNELIDSGNTENFPTLFPMIAKVAARTIAMGGWYKSEIQQLKEDRLNKLKKLIGEVPDVVLPNDKYEEGLVSVQPLSGPTPNLMYFDFKYTKKTRMGKLIDKIKKMKTKYIGLIKKIINKKWMN